MMYYYMLYHVTVYRYSIFKKLYNIFFCKESMSWMVSTRSIAKCFQQQEHGYAPSPRPSWLWSPSFFPLQSLQAGSQLVVVFSPDLGTPNKWGLTVITSNTNSDPGGHIICPKEEMSTVEMRFASWMFVATSIISLACLGLVLSSQMKWWLSSPFLNRVRWHVLLDSMNVWLFHFLSTHPSCGLSYNAATGMATLSLLRLLQLIVSCFSMIFGRAAIKILYVFNMFQHVFPLQYDRFARFCCVVLHYSITIWARCSTLQYNAIYSIYIICVKCTFFDIL